MPLTGQELFDAADKAGQEAVVNLGEVSWFPCGFAWVNVKGTQPFAKFLKTAHGCRKAYEGGIQLWISQYGQIQTQKEAYARAFSGVLRDNGVQAYSGSRSD